MAASSETSQVVEKTTPATSNPNHVVGCVRRFNNKLKYGFITVISEGDYKGQDIFVYQSGIKKGNENRYRMLYIGECVEFDIAPSGKPEYQHQAINVSGFNGHGLMCDNSSIILRVPRQGGSTHNKGGFRGPRREQQHNADS